MLLEVKAENDFVSFVSSLICFQFEYEDFYYIISLVSLFLFLLLTCQRGVEKYCQSLKTQGPEFYQQRNSAV